MCKSNTVFHQWYPSIFYKVLEKPLHDINVRAAVYSKIFSLVLFRQWTDCSATVSSCVCHNIEVHIMIIVLT